VNALGLRLDWIQDTNARFGRPLVLNNAGLVEVGGVGDPTAVCKHCVQGLRMADEGRVRDGIRQVISTTSSWLD
jgi:hypothetical protein